MPKNNLDARIRQWELDTVFRGGGKTKMHKPGSQKK